jgi:diphthamide biosynthesis protein 3
VLTLFSIQDELKDGEDVARCPSCSLIIRVIFDPDEFQDEEEGETTFTIDTSITVS